MTATSRGAALEQLVMGVQQMSAATAMDVAKSPQFQGVVNYFLAKSAIAVMAEDGATANHAARVVYAKAILAGTANIQAAAIAVQTNATVAGEGYNWVDNDVDFTITSMFNALAGVAT